MSSKILQEHSSCGSGANLYKNMRSTVAMTWTEQKGDDSGRGTLGTGVFIGNNNILTCRHNIYGGDRLAEMERKVYYFNEAVFRSSESLMKTCEMNSQLKAESEYLDLAILEVDGYLYDTVSIAQERPYRGQEVHVISMEQMLPYTYSCGIVSKTDMTFGDITLVTKNHEVIERTGLDYEESLPIIQLSGVLGWPGASGAPVFYAKGQIIGICIFRYQEVAYAVPCDRILSFLAENGISVETSKGKHKGKEKVGEERHVFARKESS